MLLILTSASCLVTDPVEFTQEENVPPVVIDGAGRENPISSILELNLNDTASRIEIPVRIRDQNVFEPLEARWRLVTTPEGPGDFEDAPIPANGEDLRDFSVRVEIGQIRQGECHRLELVVSGSFVARQDDPRVFDITTVPGDLGRAAWWIWEVSGDPASNPEAAQAITDSCDTIDALVSGSTEVAP